MFEKTSVTKDDLKVYDTKKTAVLSKMEESIDEKFKALKEQLHLAEVEWSVDKNKQIADLSALVTKCEEGLKLQTFNDDMMKALGESVRDNTRKMWELETELREIDRMILTNRVQPIEKKMKDIDKQVAAIHHHQDKRRP